MMDAKNSRKPIEHFNMTDFMQGHASKIINKVAEEDAIGYVLKYGKPMVVMISHERYERLLKQGIDIKEY